jgi:surface protein
MLFLYLPQQTSINSFDLSSTDATQFSDSSYVYIFRNQGGKIIIKIRSMHLMCRKAKPIKISIPDTIDYYIDLSECFYDHTQLIDISALSFFDTTRVVNMSEMFSRCRKLASIEPLSNWDVSNVWDMTGAFNACWRLTDLKCLSNWKVRDDCILEGFYSNRGQFLEPSGPIIGLDRLGIRNNRTRIDRYLQDHFPQWLIDRHKARGY